MDKKIRGKYQAVIGLEVHVQLCTASKAFSADKNSFGDEPNVNISAITLAHPGTLPKGNKKAVEYAVKIGLACGCKISKYNYWDRKNYFYPDLPKGYQLTQDNRAICIGGVVPIVTASGKKRTVNLNRIHMEEDAGKSIHTDGSPDTLIDLNRAGVPLLEIVTEPDLYSSEEASALLTRIRQIIRYLEISDGNMEEGSMRCDANVSVRLKGTEKLGQKVEVKNMNSMRNVQNAIDYEIERQILMLEKGEVITSETRLFDVEKGTTHSMRSKEEANDYRYFPDPDLQPLHLTDQFIADIKAQMPALPQELIAKYTTEYQLPELDAYVLTETRYFAAYFERLAELVGDYKRASNWMMGPVRSFIRDNNLTIQDFEIKEEKLAELIALVQADKVSYTAASQQLFPELLKNVNASPEVLASELNLIQESDVDSLLPIVQEVIKEFPQKVEEFKKGKKGLLGMFVGEVMKRSKGKADPKKSNELMLQELSK